MAELTIKNRSEGDVTILDLSGRVTISNGAMVLRESVREALESGKSKILLNMAGVTLIDSAGLGELVSSYTTTSNRGGQIKLLNLRAQVQDLLVITQLITVFQTFDDEREAVASFE